MGSNGLLYRIQFDRVIGNPELHGTDVEVGDGEVGRSLFSYIILEYL